MVPWILHLLIRREFPRDLEEKVISPEGNSNFSYKSEGQSPQRLSHHLARQQRHYDLAQSPQCDPTEFASYSSTEGVFD